MKKSNRNIERNIVDRLQKHEFEFDPKAWEQMEAMLDVKPSGFWAAFQSKQGTKIIAGVVLLLLFAMSVYYALPEGNASSNEFAKKHILNESVVTEAKNIENETAISHEVIANETAIESTQKQELAETKKAKIESVKSTADQLVNTIQEAPIANSSNQQAIVATTQLTTTTAPNEVSKHYNTISKPREFISQANSNQFSYSKPIENLIVKAIENTPSVATLDKPVVENTNSTATVIDESDKTKVFAKDEVKNEKVLSNQVANISSERMQFAELDLLDQSAFASLLVHEANTLDLVPAYERTKTLKRLQRKWNFGVFAGIHRGLDYTKTRENGFSGIAGVFAERKLSNSLGLQLQVNVKRTPDLNSSFSFENYYETPTSLFKVEGSYSFTSSDVLELPLMLTKSVFGGKVKFMGGIKYARILNTAVVPALRANSERTLYSGLLDNNIDNDYVLQGNSIFELSTVQNSSLSLNEEPIDRRINAIRKNDFGLVAALGYQFNKKLSIDLRYDQGVIDIAPNSIFNNEIFDSSNSLHLLLKYQF